MSDHTDRPADDDVQGHKYRRAFAEGTDEPTDDVDGHGFRRAFTEDNEAPDDVDGHALRSGRITDRPSPDDVDHRLIRGRDATAGLAADPDDDVTGHLSGALGAQKRDEGL